MAARFPHDRIDLHRIGMIPRIPAHHFFVEVFLVAAASDREARERPPELSFKTIVVLHWVPPKADIAALSLRNQIC